MIINRIYRKDISRKDRGDDSLVDKEAVLKEIYLKRQTLGTLSRFIHVILRYVRIRHGFWQNKAVRAHCKDF